MGTSVGFHLFECGLSETRGREGAVLGGDDKRNREPDSEASDQAVAAAGPATRDSQTVSERERLAAAIVELEREVRRLCRTASKECLQMAARLCDLESRSVELARSAVELEGEGNGPSRRALPAELTSWSRLAGSLGLETAAVAAAEAARHLLQEEIEEWRRQADSQTRQGDAEACFDALLQTTVLELEALSAFPHNPCDATGLTELRTMLRDRMVAALAQNGVQPDRAICWSEMLLDRSNIVLRAVDSLAPREASEQLRLSVDELRWHLRHVKTGHNPLRRPLRNKKSQLQAEYEERTLQMRLEGHFGRRAVAWFERLILLLIVLVLVLLGIEARWELTPKQLF